MSQPSVEASGPAQSSAKAPFASAPFVLVADDSDAMRELIVQELIEQGYEVYEASDGEELLWILHSMEVNAWPVALDVVVTDIRMPGLSGIDALRRLRTLRCEIPVVLMSAFPDEAARAAAEHLQAPLLAKPFPIGALLDLLPPAGGSKRPKGAP